MIEYKKHILDNGLTVLIEQDKTTTMAAVNVLYKVGSKHESKDKTGFAHLFEHLMFGGSDNAPDFDTPLQMAGGENNAFTNNDYTNFYDILPVQNIETALWLEADRMQNLTLNPKALQVQKKVVVEEFKEVCLNKPYGDAWHELSSLAYKEHHYQWPTIGKDISHIEKANMTDVSDFFTKYYQPDNAILSVSSPLSISEVIVLAEKWFGHIPKHGYQTPSLPIEPKQEEYRQKMVQSDVPTPMVLMAFHMPNRIDPEYYACDLISDLLSNGRSARLYKSLIKENQIFSEIDCYLTGSIDSGLIIIEGRPMPEYSLDQAIEYIWKEIELLKSTPVTNRELDKVKNKVISSLAMSDLSILNKAMSMAYFEVLGEIDKMNSQESIYESVTSDMIQDCAIKYLDKNNLNTLYYLPNQ